MTLDEFWDHIRATKRKDPDAHQERLVKRLAKLPEGEILDFGNWWWIVRCEAYSWNVWGAAHIINGGCSDDGFDYFRNWLVLQGRDVFQAALTNPDALADVVDPDEGDVEIEGEPATEAWFLVTKRKRDDKGYEALSAAERARHGPLQSLPDHGDGWDFDDDDEMRKRYPRLCALYNDEDADE